MTLPDDCTIRLVDMPVGVGGRISECPDGHVDIYINARLSEAGRRRAAEHELEHWREDDLHNGLDIRVVEGRHARKLPKLMKASDLAPKPLPKPNTASVPRRRIRVTSRQMVLAREAVADLDAAFGFDTIID